MIINASYRGLPVGTAAYTENMITALPRARAVRLPHAMMRSTTVSFWAKRLAELTSSLIPAEVIHPFWATSISSRHVVSALDLVQYREATSVERRLLRSAGRRARAVLVLARATGLEIGEELGRDVVVAPPFAAPAWYVRPSPPPATHSGRIRIAYWGGWHQRKGMSAFLALLGHSSISSDVEIHCTGRPPLDVGLKIRTHEGLDHEQLVRMVDSCHLSVYPSSEEGFGLPVLESLLRCRAVVCGSLPVYDEFTRGPGRVSAACWDSPEQVEAAVVSALSLPAFSPEDALLKPARATSVAELSAAVDSALGCQA